ncbi:DUF3768 domain-containing protein [Blastomonas fulva]|uniref:DUF3768 domain-containing protein n=1 Tax=Blastomonas fulva TaxID=1550728 RepID=UPI0025A32E3B|nr:DUF3768 domain-containing protein [Blastomonas fulva]MDM7927551.1 DUF3768 domain-containing protein [Blastomonas fulva]MDM7964991.1 DUF3768 domain-containing protein [Blastomonas fulva]
MSGAALTRAERIARLNDRARRAMGIACVVVATEGVRALPEADQSRLRELVETFDVFTPDNDPYGERDFGAIYQGLDGVWSTLRPADVALTAFWKIDTYDRELRFGSEDPADPAMTRRVLTIMLASEY